MVIAVPLPPYICVKQLHVVFPCVQIKPTCSCKASELPVALLAHILQHVPQQQRLTVAALVCKPWATAATLATVSVEHNHTKQSSEAFQAWLAANGGQLVSLQVK